MAQQDRPSPLPVPSPTSSFTPTPTPSPSNPQAPFPKPTVIPPRGPHTHTLILLHGRGDSSLDFSTDIVTTPLTILSNPSLSTTLPQRFPGVKFIFPSAKIGRSTAAGNTMMPQWFDIAALNPPYHRQEELQREGLRSSVNYLMDLVREEGKALGGVGKVVIGGLSQGAVVALATALSFDAGGGGGGEPLGGCVAMSGWLAFQKELMALAGGKLGEDEDAAAVVVDQEDHEEEFQQRNPKIAVKAANWFRENILNIPPLVAADSQTPLSLPKTPLWIAHGAMDGHVKPQYGEEAAKTMERLGWNVTFMLYDDLGHWYMPDELEDMAIYLNVMVGFPEAD
ncbi:hypothetical protein AJ79_00976 [Helicocarpus griseus UAMH5409]|uniref:Phospholipase/carboxylesterase/thioesterase domain-containing protein n=1 Tax=Helicocarpus griseus UAMH5409 TaxID=1447875 RepID=A0A2B7Y8P5_9EURO|nr:hypothetical protein AJ79_00976 [Helicocarpus griseus UAMH5409]